MEDRHKQKSQLGRYAITRDLDPTQVVMVEGQYNHCYPSAATSCEKGELVLYLDFEVKMHSLTTSSNSSLDKSHAAATSKYFLGKD